MKYGRIKEREITVKVIESKMQYRMLAEFFARKFNEKRAKETTKEKA